MLDLPTVAIAIETGAVCSICHSKLKMCESFKIGEVWCQKSPMNALIKIAKMKNFSSTPSHKTQKLSCISC